MKEQVFFGLQITSTQIVYKSLQYFQKNVGAEVDFLPVDKHGSFLQVDTIILSVRIQVCLKYPK